jgi:hypothetical protein
VRGVHSAVATNDVENPHSVGVQRVDHVHQGFVTLHRIGFQELIGAGRLDDRSASPFVRAKHLDIELDPPMRAKAHETLQSFDVAP